MAQAKDKKDNKRKSTTKEKASPAKKKKVDNKAKPKGKPVKAEKAKPAKKVVGSKVKKEDVKKKSSAQVKAKVIKKNTKAVQKTGSKISNDKKKDKASASKVTVKKNVKKPVKQAVKTVTRKTVAKAAVKPKVTVAKNKLKSVKKPTASKPAVKKSVKPTEKKVPEKPQKVTKKIPTTPVKQKKKPEPAKVPEKAAKRKNTAPEDAEESPRKRRIITPNKKYADFEVGVSPKKVSELRAFLQDKKNEPGKPEQKESPKKKAKSVEKKDAATKKTKEEPKEEIKVIKPSEMKPAEKLLKKLQKKLEREAKAASVIKPENKVNKDKAKIKITKVVTYNKPPLFLKAKALSKNIAAKQKSPILKAAKAASTKAKATILKEKISSPATEKLKPTDKGSKPSKNNVSKIAQTPEKAKAKKIKELKPEERPIHASFLYQKNVRFQDDPNQNCWVTGIDVFPSGDIVLVDMGNKKIKLFSKEFQRLSQVKLDTIPQDLSISPVDASCAYFTKPFSKEGIQKVAMADGKLFLKESFWTNGTNRGITCTRAGILTSVQDGRYHDLDINCFKIDLLDYEGKILQSVSTDQTGTRLFKLPLYFSVSSTGKQIIVSDCIRYNSYIVSLDMSGKIKFKYTGIRDNLITPRGLTVDDEDNIYVTEWENHNVYVLSPTGKRLQILISHNELKAQGIDDLQKPYQLCYKKREDGGQLIVSQEGCNTIKVFKITKRSPEEISKLVKEAEAAAAAAKLEKAEAKTAGSKGTPKTSDAKSKVPDEKLPDEKLPEEKLPEDPEKVEDVETNGETKEN